jgi:tetratricopeptide (TPR) repeat protein
LIDEKVYGADHPEVATYLNNLALLYKSQGKYAEAEKLLSRALTICQQVLGNDHPHTQATQRLLDLVQEALATEKNE